MICSEYFMKCIMPYILMIKELYYKKFSCSQISLPLIPPFPNNIALNEIYEDKD